MKSMPGIAMAAVLGAVSMTAHAADIPLYPSGPAEDSSFVRFINTTDAPIELKASGSKTTLALTPAKPDSGFMPVAAGKPVKGQLVRGSQQADVDVTVKPGEFATVLGLSSATGALTTQVVRESPDDFNALKASLAFYNIAPDCKQAGLQAAGRNVAIFSDVPTGQAKRRLINPVSMSVQLMCAGKASGAPLAIGMLVAGQRYSVFASPSAKGPHLSVATDTVVH
jgi:hypothetical protein